jgi:hypothetical protein
VFITKGNEISGRKRNNYSGPKFVDVVVSIYLRKGTKRFAQVVGNNKANSHANFDLETGTIGQIGVDVASSSA